MNESFRKKKLLLDEYVNVSNNNSSLPIDERIELINQDSLNCCLVGGKE